MPKSMDVGSLTAGCQQGVLIAAWEGSQLLHWRLSSVPNAGHADRSQSRWPFWDGLWAAPCCW